MITPKKVDILGDLLTSNEEEAFPGLAELNDFLSRPPERPIGQDAHPADASWNATPRGRKKKVTHYLSPAVSEELDRNLPRIRKFVPVNVRPKVSKSRLVDSSLRLLLQEFEEKGKESLFVRQFLHEDRDGDSS